MKRVMYKGYEIQAVPHLSESCKWQVNVFISMNEKGHVALKNFLADELCETLDEAEERSLDYGRGIIDERGAALSEYRRFAELVK